MRMLVVEHDILDSTILPDSHLRDPEYNMAGHEVSKRLHVMKFTIAQLMQF